MSCDKQELLLYHKGLLGTNVANSTMVTTKVAMITNMQLASAILVVKKTFAATVNFYLLATNSICTVQY